MGSKSSSGSLMKSVESMLPKNMNMKHVLLAVLVGLLLCMLMGQSVEGFKCTYPAKIPPRFVGNGGKPLTGSASVEVGPGTSLPSGLKCAPGWTGSPTVKCKKDGDELTLGGCNIPADTACSTSSGPYQTDIFGVMTACPAYCQNKAKVDAISESGRGAVPALSPPNPGQTVGDMKDKGMCVSSRPGLTDKNACARFTDQNNCMLRAGQNKCNWTTVKAYADIHSLKDLYEPLLSAMSISRFGCGSIPNNALGGNNAQTIDILKRSQVTDILPLKLDAVKAHHAPAVTGNDNFDSIKSDADKKSWPGLKHTVADDIYRDFFYLLLGSSVDKVTGGNKTKISEQLSQSTVMPENIKTKLIERVKEIEVLWDEYDDKNKTVLKKNGGRIIAGYNAANGLVIRNPPTEPVCVPGIGKAWHEGPGCPGTWDNTNNKFQNKTTTCPSTTDCSVILNNLSNIDATDRGLGATTYCGLDACSSNENLPECVINKALKDINSTIKEGIQGVISAFSK